MRRLALLVLLSLWTGVAVARAGECPRPHVYLVIIDGLQAEAATPVTMPRLFDASLEPVRLRTQALATMPTRTDPNHVTLLSGLFAEGHGITGNAYWNRSADDGLEKLESARLIEAETLFTVIETTRAELVTVAAFSKTKLGSIFGAVKDRQRAPDVMWTPDSGGIVARVTDVASDAETMDAFLAATAEREPDLAAINLSEVDRTSHQSGPRAADEARRDASTAVGRLIDDLHTRRRWERSVLVITSDHGFDDVTPTEARPEPSIELAEWFEAAGATGLHVVSDGGVAHVYADTVRPKAETLGPAASTLAWAASIAWRVPGVIEVLARLPVPGVPTLAEAHPEWGLTHERAGDLLVVAAPGYQFVEPHDALTRSFKGNHGSPAERRIPLIVAGGALGDGPPLEIATLPNSADIGMTIATLLGVRAPRRFDGRPVRAGRPIPLGPHSPHCEK